MKKFIIATFLVVAGIASASAVSEKYLIVHVDTDCGKEIVFSVHENMPSDQIRKMAEEKAALACKDA